MIVFEIGPPSVSSPSLTTPPPPTVPDSRVCSLWGRLWEGLDSYPKLQRTQLVSPGGVGRGEFSIGGIRETGSKDTAWRYHSTTSPVNGISKGKDNSIRKTL